ncbi:MAG: hypothetical protein WDZ76_12220 [Pseudohongiellaceae bacterium]
MIERLQKFATRILWLRPVILVVAVASMATVVWSLVRPDVGAGDRLIIPGIVLFSWSAMYLCVTGLFSSVPAKPDQRTRWVDRLAIGVKRGLFRILAWCFLLLTLVLLVISYQLISTWLRGG